MTDDRKFSKKTASNSHTNLAIIPNFVTNAEKDFVDNSAQQKVLEEMAKITEKQDETADIAEGILKFSIFHFVCIKQLLNEDLFV